MPIRFVGKGSKQGQLEDNSDENYKMTHALLLLDQAVISEAIDVVKSLPVNSNETQNFSDLFYILVYAAQNAFTLSELYLAKS